MVYRIFIISILFFTNSIWAFEFDKIKNFKGSFTQVVTNVENKEISYEGKLFIEKSGKVLWQYETPILKNVYILDNIVIIDEPELEQAIYTTLEEGIDILSLMENAKKTDENLYETYIKDQKYNMFIEKGQIKKIEYKDKLDNRVAINFFDSETNIEIDEEIFQFLPPDYYDIIKK